MNDTIYVSAEDKKELLRCACGLDYILSKYPWRDENNPHFVPMIARCKDAAHRLLQDIDCLSVEKPLFKKETLYEDPEWKKKESH